MLPPPAIRAAELGETPCSPHNHISTAAWVSNDAACRVPPWDGCPFVAWLTCEGTPYLRAQKCCKRDSHSINPQMARFTLSRVLAWNIHRCSTCASESATEHIRGNWGGRFEMAANGQRVRDALLTVLSETRSGKPASDLVKVVAERENIPTQKIHREVRVLLERGQIVVGPRLNLTLPAEVRQAAE